MCRHVMVVEMGCNLESCVANGIERHACGVEIKKIGIVTVDHIKSAIIEIGAELFRGYGCSVFPVPLPVKHSCPATFAEWMVLNVKLLRIHTFPPFPFAVSSCHATIIRDALFVSFKIVSLGGLIPCPGMVGMETYTEWEIILACRSCPFGKNVAFRSDILGIPGLILAIPQVEVIVMVAKHEEILSAYAFIKFHKTIGFPFLSFEERKDVFKTYCRGVSVIGDMVFISFGTFFV